MITSEKIFDMAATLKTILPYAKHEGALNMMEHIVSDNSNLEDYECGTTHCHAGWYYLAKRWDRKSRFIADQSYIHYGHGSIIMAQDLGFKDISELREWAKNNPKIWGNSKGAYMFSAVGAFNYEGKLTVEKIYNHWMAVGERQRIHEIKNDSQKSLTKESHCA